jgi:Cu-Zn family superoxide dismutase
VETRLRRLGCLPYDADLDLVERKGETGMKHVALIAAAALGLVAAVGCQSSAQTDSHAAASGDMHANHAGHHGMAAGEAGKPDAMKAIAKGIAVLHPTQGNQAAGTVRFTQEGEDSVRVVADLTGLAPNSTHGFHIHEFGDCSAPDASSAGGHFNPEGKPHGGPDAPQHHAGDLGNVTANEQGNAHLEITLHHVSVGSHPNPLLGRSVVLHAKADDLKSQPSGESGGRIACGVIGAAK